MDMVESEDETLGCGTWTLNFLHYFVPDPLRLSLRFYTGAEPCIRAPIAWPVSVTPIRIAEGPIHDSGFSILDFGLRTEQSHCRTCLRVEKGSLSTDFVRVADGVAALFFL